MITFYIRCRYLWSSTQLLVFIFLLFVLSSVTNDIENMRLVFTYLHLHFSLKISHLYLYFDIFDSVRFLQQIRFSFFFLLLNYTVSSFSVVPFNGFSFILRILFGVSWLSNRIFLFISILNYSLCISFQ